MKECTYLINTGKQAGSSGQDLYYCQVRDIKIGLKNLICSKCQHYSAAIPSGKKNVLTCNIFKEPENFTQSLTSNQTLGKYQPLGNNPQQDEFSRLVLGVKKNDDKAISYFTEELSNILSDKDQYVICVMPSHEKGMNPSGIREIAGRLCTGEIINGLECINRTTTIEAKHNNGERDPKKEIKSLELLNDDTIKNKQVLLLDDVATSGTSLATGRQLLMENGARLVSAFALGHTQFS